MAQRASDPIRPLSVAEAHRDTDVPFLVWLTARATSGLLDKALLPSGLTWEEFAIYSILRSADRVTPTKLSRWMAAPLTSVSNYVKRFESRGHVERVENPQDRRSFLIRLTPAGIDAWSAAEALQVPVSERINAALGATEQELRQALETLRPVLDAAGSPPPTTDGAEPP